MSNHIQSPKYSSRLAKKRTIMSNISHLGIIIHSSHFKYSKLQFTFQISLFTKYGHYSNLMNYTTGMSKHTCTQSQQHFCHEL